MKLVGFGTGKGQGILVILEGRKGSGWAVFVRKMRELVGSNSSGAIKVGRKVLNNNGKERNADSSSRVDISSQEVSYLAAILSSERKSVS